jgi:hypothetical protein
VREVFGRDIATTTHAPGEHHTSPIPEINPPLIPGIMIQAPTAARCHRLHLALSARSALQTCSWFNKRSNATSLAKLPMLRM